MRFRRRGRGAAAAAGKGGGHAFGEINVTPMIDVVMCLIVFYLLVGKLATDRKARVDLPETKSGEEATPAMVVVNISPAVGDVSAPEGATAAGWPRAGTHVEVDGKTIESPAQLREVILKDGAGSPVVQIRASRRLTYGQVGPVLEACSAAGASDLRLATQPEGGTTGGGGGGGGGGSGVRP